MFKRISLVILIAIAVLGSAWLCANHNWQPLGHGAKADRILVEKGLRKLTLFSGAKPIKTYSVSLGREPVGPKSHEDDNRTPEGNYTIDGRNDASSYHLALHISYPDKHDQSEAAKRGLSPGGDVMIHGIVNGYGGIGAFHRCRDWTSGCVAVTNFEIDEIWRAVPNGVRIEIRP
ncbi:MAG: L,D-transpeptidase family protein [Luteolibacter sp.]